MTDKLTLHYLIGSAFAVWLGAASVGLAASYHIHPTAGDDANPGTSPQAPVRTLERASGFALKPGDRVLLAAGQKFTGQLAFSGIAGTAEAPIVISTYTGSHAAAGRRALIDARGHVAGVVLRNVAQVQVANLELTADGGGVAADSIGLRDQRCGVLVLADTAGQFAGCQLSNLVVRDVRFEAPGFVRGAEEVRTANGTQQYGWGIRFNVTTPDATLRDIVVQDCVISNVCHTGFKLTAPANGIRNVLAQRVTVLNSGGPGVQMSGVVGGLFRELSVTGSGSTRDSRNWGRGSGLWTWSTSDVVIEHSRFLNANGPGDSAGVHIDFHCRNVIVQYNLSANNAGGFCEILGNNYNCAYRYNVSVNDGHRVKGKNGAFQEGKTFWLSGYTGDKAPRRGPFNSYFYNNTIYLSADRVAKFAIAPTTDGLLIANNIFCLEGDSQQVAGDQTRRDQLAAAALPNVVFRNNLFLKPENWPAALPIRDAAPLVGDPQFTGRGGLKLEDYIPRVPQVVKDRGVKIERLPNDAVGLKVGLAVERDILGRPIVGAPDLGAIELPDTDKPQFGAN